MWSQGEHTNSVHTAPVVRTEPWSLVLKDSNSTVVPTNKLFCLKIKIQFMLIPSLGKDEHFPPPSWHHTTPFINVNSTNWPKVQ